VDWDATVYVNGKEVGKHRGGYDAWSVDMTDALKADGEQELLISVWDPTDDSYQPRGKQVKNPEGIWYTSVTGIWQTVWMEAVSPYGLKDVTSVPDLDGSRFVFTPRFYALKPGLRLRVTLKAGATLVGQVETVAANGVPCVLPIHSPRPWSPEDPFLYDVSYEVLDGPVVIDSVSSYAGLRKVHIEGNQIYLNNAPIFLRLVLDQGFYPEGIWTAPSDEALKHDIELSMQAGFNGARLHQKVFEERFHYWADRLGYLSWGESSSWGIDVKDVVSARAFLAEWREIVARDRNHPSIIAWTPFNETHDVGDGHQHNRLHRDAAQLTRDLDPTRPVNDASGYVHVDTDIWTVHTYQQDIDLLRDQLAPKPESGVYRNFPDREADYAGQPYIVDEFGGIKWIPRAELVYAENSWGYGEGPKTLDEFYTRLEGMVDVLLGFEHITGFCYTQLTDVEQEQNGVYNYDRTEKFDMGQIKRIFSKARPRG